MGSKDEGPGYAVGQSQEMMERKL